MGGRPQSVFPGETYGRLTVLNRNETKSRCFDCVCSCGKTTTVYSNHLLSGATSSCGCYHKEVTSKAMSLRQTKHGMYGTKVYAVWNSMMDRCCNERNRAYENYGARGITVCKEWMKFENFYADMGEPNGLTLERIDNNLGYSKTNCKWATPKEQMNNRRACVYLTYKGKTQSVSNWAAELHIPRGLIYDRLRLGWSVEDIFCIAKRGAAK